MSSDKKKSRMRSIANQLNGHFRRRAFVKLLLIDILVVCLILVTWGLTVEAFHGGRIFNVSGRTFGGFKRPDIYNITDVFGDVKYIFTVNTGAENTAVRETETVYGTEDIRLTGVGQVDRVITQVKDELTDLTEQLMGRTEMVTAEVMPQTESPVAVETDVYGSADTEPVVYAPSDDPDAVYGEYETSGETSEVREGESTSKADWEVVVTQGPNYILETTPYFTVVTRDADVVFTVTAFGFAAAFVIQLFFFIISCFTGKRTIKRYLRPIDEIALNAERISAESLVNSEKRISSMRQENTEKMRNLEESINEIGTFDEEIHIGDSELGGLEAAVNNMLRRLAESNRKQIRFVDDASHELRTPIAVIQGYVNMLDRWGKDDPKVMEESIAAIKAESEHMKTLVDQLLFLARGDMERLRMNEEEVSLAELTAEIYEESVMIDRDHEYRQILPEEDGRIFVDLAMFKQCVRILIENAAKYTPAGGTITIKSCIREGNACIEITDTGCGISRGDMPHIFDRFYRSDTARATQGSGLGLSIAKWIVEKHNGRIDAISREGTGTRMTVVVKAL